MLFLLGLLAQAAAPSPAASPPQVIAVDVPDEFKTGWHQQNPFVDQTELIVPPETVERWTRMVTIQNLMGLASRTNVDQFYDSWRNGLSKACPDLIETEVWGNVDGARAIRGDIACPRNPQTGLPENIVAVLVDGAENFTMVQIAVRRPRTREDERLVQHILGSLKRCDGSDLDACRMRRGVGFVVASK